MERLFNQCEAALWLLVAIALSMKAWRARGEVRRVLTLLSGGFVAFGISDVIEARTGSWWEPWWLLVWKCACVAALLVGFHRYCLLRTTRKSGREGRGKPGDELQ
jgi:hypothetical protein